MFCLLFISHIMWEYLHVIVHTNSVLCGKECVEVFMAECPLVTDVDKIGFLQYLRYM
jgi:hypothetical protein